MATTPHDSPGTSFVFSGTTFTVTNITVNFSDVSGETDRIDISHLGQTTGETMLTQRRPLIGSATGETGKEVSFDYIGTSQLAGGSTGSYSLGGAVSLSGSATIVSSSLTLAVNDVVRGSATVRVS
tara:strand:+ start:142 stop:519 length:378 start_codon:yes stop_codon:yes gene_type:complete